MGQTLERPPKTMMEVFQTLPEGTLVELIENALYLSPSPNYKHQKLLQFIFRHLSSRITDNNSGEVILAPFDVYLDESANAVQPDIIVVLNENFGIINESGHIHGVPDLLVEVLSEGNKDHDLIRKKDLYERFGVKEYWIVDPETKLAMVYQLRKGKYQLLGEKNGSIESELLDLKLTF